MSVMGTRHEERDADEDDSLFGSPPPSPGRPASPTLALPSSGYYSGRSASTAAAQNVGTIALPGSHPDSELPLNPLALSLNHGIVHRPPALPHQMQHQSPSSSSPFPTYGHLPVSSANLMRGAAPAVQAYPRSTSAGPSTLLKKQPKKRTRPPSRNQPSPKPAVPEFTLPDPTAPPPTHFLRNQENLLGMAGRIARVKPATLTHIRGSTPSNPILVDDEDDRPTLGRRPPQATSEKPQPYIDPALLTAPTNQEIVSVLIGQKDIFPILEGVFKLLVRNAPAVRPKTGFENTMQRDHPHPTSSTPTPLPSSSIYPLKKRKLNRVPAGATDWDVPYPFPQGEGPEEYHKNWEHERGKQLISQLIQLIKSAARKAATKKYLAQQKKVGEDAEGGGSSGGAKQKGRRLAKDSSEPPTNALQDGHSRQPSCEVLQVTNDTPSASCDSATLSSTNHGISQVPSPSPNLQHTQTDSVASEMDPSMAVAFDQFMSSLDNIPDQGSPQAQPTIQDAAAWSTSMHTQPQNFFAPQNTNTTISDNCSVHPGSTGTTPTPTPADQPLFDTWMSFLESFPINFDGTPNALHTQSNTSELASTSTSQCSTTMPGTPLGDSDFANMLGVEMAGAGAGALAGMMSEFDAMLASMFQQQQQQPQESQQQNGAGVNLQIDIGSSNFVAPQAFGDHLIDPNLLALSLENQAVSSMAIASSTSTNPGTGIADAISFDAISPMASGSSLGGSTSPGTPVSAGWELSMPDIFMDEGAVGSGISDRRGWANNLGEGSEDAMMDFRILPNVVEDVQSLGGHTANAKGKCKEKERELGPAPMARSISRSPPGPILTSTPTPIPALSQSPLQLHPGPSQLLFDNELLNPRGPSITRPLLKIFSRQLRRDDIIRRAEEQKRVIQQELNAVKTRLWETTIEQAGLVTLQKRLAMKAVNQGEGGAGQGGVAL